MNEQKLKMLLKFEKISMLEEFYNVRILTLYYIKQCHPDQQISLEVEVQDDEIKQTALLTLGQEIRRKARSNMD